MTVAPVLPGFEPTVPAPAGPERQASLDDLGTPLAEVTFVVVDLETTGTSPGSDAITEIGAVRMRGGELLGTFDTLVNPGVPIPPTITVLTGITEAMVLPAPRIGEVLPAFCEFARGAVLVGHNLRFDTSFLDAALVAHGRPRLDHRRVDTLAIARRLVRDEVPNLRLGTLAEHFRTTVRPVHRAWSDAAATGEVLHALLERAAAYGVLGLDDLLALPTLRAHPSAAKLALTARLPRAPGVYCFRDRDGRVLYVGKATNLRERVRSYFTSDDRRKVPQLLRETTSIDHRVCADAFEAEVREGRLIRALQPRFNRRGKGTPRAHWLRLSDERFPRLVVGRTRPDGGEALGPFRSAASAHAVREAIETVVPLRRCAGRIGKRTPIVPGPPCLPAQLGVATCPCRGHTDESAYADLVATVRRGLGPDPDALCRPLAERMHGLAAVERFEEAALTRDRLGALTRAVARQRALEQLRAAGDLVLDGPSGRMTVRDGGIVLADEPLTEAPHDDEVLLVARWLDRHAASVRLLEASGALVSVLPRIPDYRAGASPASD